MLTSRNKSGILQSCSPVSDAGPYPLLYNLNDGQVNISLVHQINPHLAFCPSSYHDSLKLHFMQLQILFPKSLTTFQKVSLRSCSVFKGAGFTHRLISSEFSGAHFTLGWTQRDSSLEAMKCLAKYQLMKAICYTIIQNKSWLTYLLGLFLKEIIHEAERCETVNIIYIDWGKKKKQLYLRGDWIKGLATSSESIVLVRIKICLKGFVLVISLLGEGTAQGDDKWRIILLYLSSHLQMT